MLFDLVACRLSSLGLGLCCTKHTLSPGRSGSAKPNSEAADCGTTPPLWWPFRKLQTAPDVCGRGGDSHNYKQMNSAKKSLRKISSQVLVKRSLVV